MRFDISIKKDKNDYLIEVLDTWRGKGIRRAMEIIPPKTWFWKRNKFIKEKINKEIEYIKEDI